MSESRMVRTNKVSSSYRLQYADDFPLAIIICPPIGWRFHKVQKWRVGCEDECWRVMMKRI